MLFSVQVTPNKSDDMPHPSAQLLSQTDLRHFSSLTTLKHLQFEVLGPLGQGSSGPHGPDSAVAVAAHALKGLKDLQELYISGQSFQGLERVSVSAFANLDRCAPQSGTAVCLWSLSWLQLLSLWQRQQISAGACSAVLWQALLCCAVLCKH